MDKMIHDPNVVESSTIGFINFKKSIGECKIEVFSLEGPVPHFHISNTDGSFNCCVQIIQQNIFLMVLIKIDLQTPNVSN